MEQTGREHSIRTAKTTSLTPEARDASGSFLPPRRCSGSIAQVVGLHNQYPIRSSLYAQGLRSLWSRGHAQGDDVAECGGRAVGPQRWW